MPRALRSPVASGPTRRAAKCFGSKRGRRALQTVPALPDVQFLMTSAESCTASWTPVCAILKIVFAIISVRGRRDP